MNRREFIGVGTTGASLSPAFAQVSGRGYKHRLAFDVWINNVRNESMPLENWPYGVLDDKTVDGITRALDVQSQSGYTAIDLAGLLSTYSWPVDIKSLASKDRVDRYGTTGTWAGNSEALG